MTFGRKPEDMPEERWEIVKLVSRGLDIAINRLTILEFMALIGSALNELAFEKGLSHKEMQTIMQELMSAQEEIWKKYGYPKTREEAI